MASGIKNARVCFLYLRFHYLCESQYDNNEKNRYDHVQNPYLRPVACRKCKRNGHPGRLGAESPQPGCDDLHRPAGPLRHHPDRRRRTLSGRCQGRGRRTGPRIRPSGRRPRGRAFVQEPEDAYGRHRSRRLEARGAARGRSAPVHHRGELGRRRRPAYEIPLPRPAPSSPAAQHDPASQDGPGDSPLPERRRFPGDRNPLPGQFHARRRPRLRRAEPHEPQPILRPAPSRPRPSSSC